VTRTWEPDARLANGQHLQGASTSTMIDGSAAGTRVLTVHSAGGLHARVLLDRGLDVGATWYAGQPVSWTSPSGERRPGHAGSGEEWHRGWAGGLLTTCGLRHIGPPRGGRGRHGSFSDQPAEDVTVARGRDDDRRVLEVCGSVRDTDGLDRGLVLRRSLRWFLGEGRLQVRDEVVNETGRPLSAPILYHLNFGHPFLVAESVTSLRGLRRGDGFTARMGDPATAPDEVVEHRAEVATGRAGVTITAPGLGQRLVVDWLVSELGRAHTWRRREPGCYVHAVEPANAALTADGHDPWPVLAPGERRTTGFNLTVGPDDADHPDAPDI